MPPLSPKATSNKIRIKVDANFDYLPSFPHTNRNVLCFPKAQAACHRLKLATVYSSHHNGN